MATGLGTRERGGGVAEDGRGEMHAGRWAASTTRGAQTVCVEYRVTGALLSP